MIALGKIVEKSLANVSGGFHQENGPVNDAQNPVARAVVIHVQGDMNAIVLTRHPVRHQLAATNRLAVVLGDI
jgi:hypothetical protein